MKCKLASLIDAHNLKVSQTGDGDRLTQRSLAKKSEVSVAAINRLYNNSTRRFDSDVVEKVCHTLECEISDLFELASN